MRPANSVTRRQVLGGLAAGTIAVPTIVPSTVLGRDGKAPPSERITVGFIGCGKMANDYHLPELLGFGDVQALAVCEVDKKRREHAKKRVEKAYGEKKEYKGCATYVDFRELVGRQDIDAVCIATPEHWHAIPAIEANAVDDLRRVCEGVAYQWRVPSRAARPARPLLHPLPHPAVEREPADHLDAPKSGTTVR